MSIYGTGPKGKATRLHAELVRSRGRCEAQGHGFGSCAGVLECAHIISRRYSATRTDERNAWALCKAHHMRLTAHPDEHMALVGVTIGMVLFGELKERALSNVRPWKPWEWEAEVERLAGLLREAA